MVVNLAELWADVKSIVDRIIQLRLSTKSHVSVASHSLFESKWSGSRLEANLGN